MAVQVFTLKSPTQTVVAKYGVQPLFHQITHLPN